MPEIEYIIRKIKPVYVDGKATDETETVDVFCSCHAEDDAVDAKITALMAKPGVIDARVPYTGGAKSSPRHYVEAYNDPARIRRSD